MKNKERALFGAVCFLSGIVIGFLFAPIKKGIYCANNNGNYFGRDEEKNITEENKEI